MSAAFIEAAVQVGLARNPDFNGAELDGVGFADVNQKRGRRWSAADAYLHPAVPRPNCSVFPNAQAIRVLFEGKRAVGIEYVCNGRREIARAGEVILSGGTLIRRICFYFRALGRPRICAITELTWYTTFRGSAELRGPSHGGHQVSARQNPCPC